MPALAPHQLGSRSRLIVCVAPKTNYDYTCQFKETNLPTLTYTPSMSPDNTHETIVGAIAVYSIMRDLGVVGLPLT